MGTRPELRGGVAEQDLSGQTALVTGSTSGIGRQLALAIGRLGADVIVHGRDPDAGEAVREALVAAGTEATFVRADLATIDGVRALADRVREETAELDVLCNNAGVYRRRGELTADGIEYTIAVNHLAPFALTGLLLPALRAADDPRVITTSSGAHEGGSIDLDRFESVADYSPFAAYSQSKLANVLFTRELDRRMSEVCATCFHPGFVPGSRFLRDLPRPLFWLGRALGNVPLVGTSPAAGAATGVYLAAADDVACGRYYANCRERRPAAAARDDQTARALWERSEALTGVSLPPLV